ncbi:gliding motility-associated C-terminal domain-containing protein [Chryseobacterium carnipullorum]|uniref:Gliding motility-associated C-terminal domain n=1 Tax=Chryseobacterium carnipullorum TaxID=1124835 RepID=A0A1M7CFQ4_CHRCU|nr:T9SS type B sorting domain-containing protein [Chryseobacterium carnipullorum]MDN5475700.1 gliding motility-associated C-terminal domain-containing protein [Chryseobacterium sp.]AZA47532.1 gliding motility-associated C-terminal domain-containing protein [Chryseobacterium carnipullorum]AZA66865.1 gliding motility-associated C-terminal domain-containing protein [Chryseobacterium carnipullorum]SHL66091.1 gliding motility-associated C-terminal domain-containing protein [Chryseobacterium carnipul
MKKTLLLLILFIAQVFHAQSDCVSAIPLCGNSEISYTPSGHGDIVENLSTNGCLGRNENYSVWYTFTVATAGTLTFVIDPNVNSDDYDFAVYGPTTNGCTSLNTNNVFVTPLRCNYNGSTPTGNTGLTLTLPPPPPPNTNGNAGNAFEWSPYMQVQAGETYYLVVDNFRSSPDGFKLIWGGTASLSSAFNDPVLAPNPFLPPGIPNADATQPSDVMVCGLPSQFNFNTLTAGIVNGNNPNFKVTYHNNTNDVVTGNSPLNIATVNGTTTYYYRIRYLDPDNPDSVINKCFISGKFKFKDASITAKNATIFACNNNGEGTGKFDLTTADVFTGGTKKYYPTLADLNADTNEITNPTNYISAQKIVYAKVISAFGCTAIGNITLSFHPVVTLKDALIQECYIENDILRAKFDLTLADVGAIAGQTKKFYKTLTDATAETNPIAAPDAYLTASTEVYVRVTNANQCYAISKITLKVLPPVKSAVLKDKTICAEEKTTLDAGPGFDGYEWSTGATTQSISNAGIGVYWVKLKTGKCFTLQTVTIFASTQPVIASVEISNNTITVNASGGTPPYMYSTDGVTWQASNSFSGLPRGENKIFLKDSFNCNPIQITVTVPNLINAITPNGDKVNDEVDYSALAYKKNLVFIVYDRYGNKLYEANKMRDYKWDGTASGKKIPTGTYWYSISWNENDKNGTETKYSGWILVKNKE